MRVFVAGASGVIGVRLLPLLVSAGHDVLGITRTPTTVVELRALGADAVVCDVFDAAQLEQVVTEFRPDVIVHQLTDLPDDPAQIGEHAAGHARIRREGTRNLLAAARAAGVKQVLAQSIAWPTTGEGAAAVEDLESAVLEHGGVVLRYGQFYGPGTYYPVDLPTAPRISVDEAARQTLGALDATGGVLTLTED